MMNDVKDTNEQSAVAGDDAYDEEARASADDNQTLGRDANSALVTRKTSWGFWRLRQPDSNHHTGKR